MITPPTMSGSFRWEAETAGLVTALVESGLADLRGVAPEVGARPLSPGLTDRVATGAEHWNASLALGTEATGLRVSLDLCDPLGACAHHEALGTREAPFSAVASLLAGAATQLRRTLPDETRARWEEPPSTDDYAVLVCGRAAATWYGLLPPPAPEQRGNPRADPLARAVFLDPSMHLAWWVVGRDALERGEEGRAVGAFEMALARWPDRPLYGADLAVALLEADEPARAMVAWSGLPTGSERDPRFALAWARAALLAHELPRARDLLGRLPAELADDPAVVALQVDLAVVDGVGEDDLRLLQKWARVDSERPEPVERAIAALMDLGRADEAMALLPELERRGRAIAAATLAVPLALERRDWARSESAARSLGWDPLAERIALRAELEADPQAQPTGLLWATDDELVLARASRWLARGEYADALADAEQVLDSRPWSPGGLLLASQARRALGDEAGATEALGRLAEVDPEGLYRREGQRLAASAQSASDGAGPVEGATSPEGADSPDGSGSAEGSSPAAGAASPEGSSPTAGAASSKDAGSPEGADSPEGAGSMAGAASPEGSGSAEGSSPAAGAASPEDAGSPEGAASPEGEGPEEGEASMEVTSSEADAGGPSTAAGATGTGVQPQAPVE